MSLWSVRGRNNFVRLLRTNRNFTGVLNDFASLFRFNPSSSFDDAEKTILNSVVMTNESVLDSVVKIHTFSSKPNIFYPWQNNPQRHSKGSGFVISGKRIITNAHVVADHILVQVIKHGSPKKYKAEVKAIARECDLAILVIESQEFWEDMNPLELGDMPSRKESVVVVGYPEGGESISTTTGVVNRIESKNYGHGATNLPVIQTDAAINHGNSGGPVCIGNKVVGVAFQHRKHSNCIGYLIPAPVVKHFITGIEKTGVLINNIYQHSDALNILKKDDIILAIDGVAIENDGIVVLPNREKRITLDDLVSMKQSGEKILLKVLREGKMHDFSITLKPVQRLVDNNSSYYIFAGFVFVPLSKQHIKSSNAMHKLAYNNNNNNNEPKKAGDQIVIISEILADVINVEFFMFKNLQVKSVNEVKVENLKHLYELIEKCCDKDLRLDLGGGRVIVLDYQSAKSSTSLILERHRVPWAMSKDLMIGRQSKTCLSTSTRV